MLISSYKNRMAYLNFSKKDSVKMLLCEVSNFLVILTFLTGGFWYRSQQPRLFLEWTLLSCPMSLSMVMLWWTGKTQDLRNLITVGMVQKFWQWWKNLLMTKPLSTLWKATGVCAFIYFLVILKRHDAFETHEFDLGIFVNAIWNLVNGFGYSSSIKELPSLFMDHQSPIFWLIAPFYALFPHPELLFAIQSLAIASGGVMAYLIARQWCPRHAWIPYFCPLAYFFYRPFLSAAHFDFHPEVLMLPLFLSALFFLAEQSILKRILGFFFLALALGCKESAGPILVGISFSWILGCAPESSKVFLRRVGLFTLVLGFGVFIFDLFIVPKLFGTHYSYLGEYSYILKWDFKEIFSTLGQRRRWSFFIFTFGPFLFLPLLYWKGSFACWIASLMLILAKSPLKTYGDFHYGIEPGIAIFAFLAPALTSFEPLVQTFCQKKIFFKPIWNHQILLILMFLSTLCLMGRSPMWFLRRYTITSQMNWLRTKLLPALNLNQSLAVPSGMVPHVANRHFIITNEPRVFQKTLVDCVLNDQTSTHLEKLPYQKVWECEKWSLYERIGLSEKCMLQTVPCFKGE